MNVENGKICCDTCKCYNWYYDWCDKYKCFMDARSMCSGYESQEENMKKEGETE